MSHIPPGRSVGPGLQSIHSGWYQKRNLQLSVSYLPCRPLINIIEEMTVTDNVPPIIWLTARCHISNHAIAHVYKLENTIFVSELASRLTYY